MSRIEQIGDCTLYLGDCLEILPTLGKVDAVVTDPPYLVSKGGFDAITGWRGGWMQEYKNQGNIVSCDIAFSDWFGPLFSTMRDNSQAYFMTNGRNIKSMQMAAEEAGFRLHTILVWDKRTALPNKYYQNVTEFALFMFKGNASTINDPASKNLVSIFQRDDSKHPTEKPVSLMEMWIKNSSRCNETILDPFMGSGTTGVACVKLSRKFIGIEIEPKYFDIACKRIEKAMSEPRLALPEPKMKQDKMEL